MPEGTTIWRGRQGRRDRDPGALPRRALRPGRRVPHVRRRRRRARVRGRLRAPVRGRHGGQDRDARARAQPRAARPSCCWSTSRRSRRTRRRRRPPTTSCWCSSAATASSRRTADPARGSGRGEDYSNPVIAVNHDACILCDRCVRACDDIQGNDVIGRSGKGYSTRIAFDLNDPMGESSCVTCGECVAACPTGALTNKPINGVPIRPRDGAAAGRHGLPVLRRRLRADLPRRRRAQGDRLRRGPRPARLAAAGCASRAATAGTTPLSSSA